MTDSLPIIDLAPLADGEAGLDKVAAAIGAACRDVGFFYALNHGVKRDLMDEAFAEARRFFALPLADKEAIAMRIVGGNRGYSALLGEALDPARGPDLKEAFNIGLDLEPDDPELLAGKPFRALNAWPSSPGFRETTLAYFDACAALGLRIHRAFARDLDLPPGFFEDKFDRSMATLRLLRYPPAASERGADVGAGVHTDYGAITLLATDDVGGLQAQRRDGRWIDAPPLPGAFVVNIGDCLMRWTNDVYVSTPHRVINVSPRERYSIAFFFDPNPDAEIAAIASCVGDGAPKYPPIRAADYLTQRLDATYLQRDAKPAAAT